MIRLPGFRSLGFVMGGISIHVEQTIPLVEWLYINQLQDVPYVAPCLLQPGKQGSFEGNRSCLCLDLLCLCLISVILVITLVSFLQLDRLISESVFPEVTVLSLFI